ncbi:hypothetical protein E3N88_26549 [Mikania micrantha]|uniref:Vacuole membrane protein KMS1 n=1 Tax=Mikania micrantha TaxID=192012 RepID=A0A5N6MUB4_9ASTR|nr:hypothetical protein E3N88_26549 [Mikania micrantha]
MVLMPRSLAAACVTANDEYVIHLILQHVEELLEYVRFGLWWVALGVASSIGLGSGLHTFVLYLGPHIAFFTIKAMQCGRVDIKSAIYDTIQLNRSPSWLKKDCSEFGPPMFLSPNEGIQVPVTSILPQVQVEAILWGLGTALGELPPYFISRAASISGEKIDAAEELDASSSENNGVASNLNHMKQWFLSHAQYLNFFTILVLASVPNPLFDLAGIMCGQFGIPFWKFFLATLHIQTVFIISVCNNQLLYWIENELIWMLSFIPGVASTLPNIVAKLHAMKEKYMAAPLPVTSNIKGGDGRRYCRGSRSLAKDGRRRAKVHDIGGDGSEMRCEGLKERKGEIMGFIVCFDLELDRMANVVQLFREDCEFNITEISQKAARK